MRRRRVSSPRRPRGVDAALDAARDFQRLFLVEGRRRLPLEVPERIEVDISAKQLPDGRVRVFKRPAKSERKL